ncbi:MAG: phosphomannomutase/phosphoglucomutase [Desulfobacterota bacterium]|nr:phosphomannomutase/phosphoglucomutase [Thermodesulfobacteriota bacterium]
MQGSNFDYIFREYDIRGNVDTELTSENVLLLGRAIGTFYRRNGVDQMTLGRDCRCSSERIRDALLTGLLETGMTVVDIGLCHTPLLYFSLFNLNIHAGVMITGSHNPPEFNGFKICLGTSTIYGEQIQDIKRIAESGEFVKGIGTVIKKNILSDYISHIAQDIKLYRPLTVVVDAGNGTAGLAAVPLLQRIGCSVIPLYCEPDGTFPHHHPDPTIPEYLQDLIATVQHKNADIGISYDGDGDRIGVVDEQGRIFWGDQLMIVFARDILKQYPGATIISEVKASSVFYDDVARHGGRPIMWKTGHSLIKAKMKEEGALLAGEMSGHMFFADRYFGFDDAIYASCRLVEILSKTNGTMSSLLSDVPRLCSTPEIRIDCPDHKKFSVVAALKEYYAADYDIITIDGVRITMPGGWALVRASNTQPVLVLRFEAATPQRLAEIQNEITDRVHRAMAAEE